MNEILSFADHLDLVRSFIESFVPNFAPGSLRIYTRGARACGDVFDSEFLGRFGVDLESFRELPDVVLFHSATNRLLLIQSVTCQGAIDSNRRAGLAELFSCSSAVLVFLTIFPNRAVMASYLDDIAWETEAWVADAPSHLIHFNGERFLGPYFDG